jgi:protein-disulfide isomerase
VVAAAVIVVVAIVISQGGAEEEQSAAGGSEPVGAAQEREMRRLFAGIPQDGVSLGRPDAPATLIEFADLQCPFCAEFGVEALPAVVRDYVRTGELRLELRLLAFLGEDSARGARLAAAAALQDRAWQFGELFFRNQGPENSGYATDAFLRSLARQTPGLDTPRAWADRDGPAARRILLRAEARARELGVEGTPSFYLRLDGRPARALEPGALDAGSFAAALDRALAGG